MDEIVEYIKSIGFVPVFEGEENTLYSNGKMIISVNDFGSVEELKLVLGDTVANPKEYKNDTSTEEMNPVGEAEGSGEPAADGSEAGGTEDGTSAEDTGNVSSSGYGNVPGGNVQENNEEENPFSENSENVDAFYMADIVKNTHTPVFRRLTLGGNRYYYRNMEDGSVKIYASATNLIKDGYADSKDGLNEWKTQMKFIGKDPEEVAKYEADKGTIMHYLFDLFLTGRDMYLRRSYIRKLIRESDLRISKENIERFVSSDDDTDNMIDRLRRFAKFCYDYKVVPIMIEKILSYDEYNVASPIDLVCQMTVEEKQEGYFGEVYKINGNGFKKGDPKKSTKIVPVKFFAIVDFKSGGIYSSHSLQLELYRRAVKQWYGDLIPIKKIFNFSPKSESSKEYTLRDQTECKELRKADAVYMQGAINHENKDKTFKTYRGCLNINKEYNNNDYIVTYDIAEELRKLNG